MKKIQLFVRSTIAMMLAFACQAQPVATTMATAGTIYYCQACSTNPPPNPNPPPTSLGGSFSTGGDASTGGQLATGGTSSFGGRAATGGAKATGGNKATGGASAQTQEQLACANLSKLGCPEGANANCATTMAARCSNPKVSCNTPCIINATSKTVLQTKCLVACGSN